MQIKVRWELASLSPGASPLLSYNCCSIPFKSAPALLLHPCLFLPPQEPKLLACASLAIFSYCPSGFRGSFILSSLYVIVNFESWKYNSHLKGNLGIANGVFYCHVQHQCWIYVLGLKKLVSILRSKKVGFMIFIVFQFSPICAKWLFQQKFYFKRIFQNKALILTFQNSIITIWLRF
jgi:hypothetical protein